MTNPRIKATLKEVLADGIFVCVRMGATDPVVDACRAAVSGGLTVLEITLTTPGATDAIRELSRDPGVIVGAGTVLTPEDVRAACRAGARFVMSPVYDPGVVDEAHLLDLLAVPGAATPKEILAAHRHGASLVKVFPSGALGGPDYLRALNGPLPNVPLVPTSGPSADNLGEYLDAGAVALGVGRDIFPPGFTLQSVEMSAHRMRSAMDMARHERRVSDEGALD